MKVQAADRRQLGATSTPPSLPALDWRRDLQKVTVNWAPSGAFFADGAMNSDSIPDGQGATNCTTNCAMNCDVVRAIAAVPGSHGPDRPAAVMVLAPVLGLAIWIGLFALI